ncbi:molybdopterin-dependent oxidoreductase [Mycolicibacter algericus]|uniref:Molybdopterin oxidoreductase n=2 Tax=Mycolicibacter algericus TaxID=1288388 RepID=A0ABX3RWL4_MYCAL|nr:molybdopterin-dependent oxidoreductase [Mycolicibacter algericus]OQZ98011.1 molybdopterin oxidoreductase [Mycolicibacter algericus DSM 45454]GFG83661.1 putative oxidoreductase [Mycolicibacter algericus]
MSEVTLTTGREPTLKPSACILCECNCGIEVLVEPDTGRFLKIRGDKAHPASAGYTCNKALRLDAYQNGRNDRLTKPLRRREDGTFEEVEWDAALTEIAERLMQLRDEHGGESIFYYGGGGQGNHLGGAYAPATMAAYGARFRSSALAQEKTGEFWVAARMLGRPHRSDFEHCEVAVFVGKNPYQSHGFPRARSVLKEIGKDPSRSMIVIDPVRTQTAELADFHLQLRPGTDLHLLTAMVAVLVQEDLIDHAWLAEHTDGLAEVAAVMREVSVAENCAVADVPEDLVRAAARRIAEAGSVAMLEDLGIQMNRNSTVVSYVEKLVWLLTGNFAKRGTQYVFSGLAPIARDRGLAFDDIPRTPVSGAAIVSGLIPCNSIPDEILTVHPDRFRAVIVESSNPLHSLADSVRMTEAFRALELVVVIDIAMTETAREADYVLPPPTQYEKYEATFFDFEFPRNLFHLRHPLLEAPAGQLAEPEIHARLCELAGAVGEADYAPLRAALAQGREAFAQAMLGVLADRRLAKLAPVLLYRTLGPTLPDGAAGAAVLWGASLMCAMENPAGVARAGYGEGLMAGDRLFEAILASPHGVVITDDEDDESWRRLGGRRIQLDVPELLDVVRKLGDDEAVIAEPDYPLVLSAGERRDFTANTIFRDPAWRKRDPEGALRVSQADAAALSLATGDRVRVSTRRGSAEAVVTVVDTMRQGHISLPNGLGLVSQDGEQVGVRLNNLTASADRDEFVGTPWHKSVPARLKKI